MGLTAISNIRNHVGCRSRNNVGPETLVGDSERHTKRADVERIDFRSIQPGDPLPSGTVNDSVEVDADDG